MDLRVRTPDGLGPRKGPPLGETIPARMEECHCGAAVIHTFGGSIGRIAESTGFTPVPNSNCGFTWICPACLPRVKAGLNLLREHFGRDTSHMHFAGLIMRMEREEV